MTRKWLLRQGNADLRRHNIYVWTLPAWVVQLPSGRFMNVCPSAGVCADLCFARWGTYRFSNVRAAHMQNLMLTLESLPRFERLMTEEVQHQRYAGGFVRIHDAGDFYSREYLEAWLRIADSAPDVSFYCYSKEVTLLHRVTGKNGEDAPPNFAWCPSLGGREDRHVDLTRRHADVFPDEEAIGRAGYASQSASDLLAVYGPERVGIPANNIPHLRRRQGTKESFGSLQRARDARLDRKNARRPSTVTPPPDQEPEDSIFSRA
ncbi:GP88 family protein [Streptomyces parvus]|uniref:GP88 family protein n=1 Tax=Streptomyces parvus TaxID=66428 RepID=UPI0021008256|nr:hypothetical protein [Streptomyces parvus]MCQ1581229.1 hypothetical protein [Streptomyces parvus]